MIDKGPMPGPLEPETAPVIEGTAPPEVAEPQAVGAAVTELEVQARLQRIQSAALKRDALAASALASYVSYGKPPLADDVKEHFRRRPSEVLRCLGQHIVVRPGTTEAARFMGVVNEVGPDWPKPQRPGEVIPIRRGSRQPVADEKIKSGRRRR